MAQWIIQIIQGFSIKSINPEHWVHCNCKTLHSSQQIQAANIKIWHMAWYTKPVTDTRQYVLLSQLLLSRVTCHLSRMVTDRIRWFSHELVHHLADWLPRFSSQWESQLGDVWYCDILKILFAAAHTIYILLLNNAFNS